MFIEKNEECRHDPTEEPRVSKVDDSLVDEVEHVIPFVDICREIEVLLFSMYFFLFLIYRNRLLFQACLCPCFIQQVARTNSFPTLVSVYLTFSCCRLPSESIDKILHRETSIRVPKATILFAST